MIGDETKKFEEFYYLTVMKLNNSLPSTPSITFHTFFASIDE
jgi:hypothetical protein